MFGAIPAEWLLDEASRLGIYTQLELDLPRHYVIDEEFLTDCTVAYYRLDRHGNKNGSMGHVDHPSFTALRNHLEAVGYIETQDWWNGDQVLKPFYLNDFYFGVGDKFSCATALRSKFRFERKRLNKKHDDTQTE